MERREGILLEMDALRFSVNGINHCLFNCFYLNFTQSPFYEITRLLFGMAEENQQKGTSSHPSAFSLVERGS